MASTWLAVGVDRYEESYNSFYAMFQSPALPSVVIYGIYGILLIYSCEDIWRDPGSRNPNIKVQLTKTSDKIGVPLVVLFQVFMITYMLLAFAIMAIYGLYWVFTKFMPPTIQIFDLVFNNALGPIGYHIYRYGYHIEYGVILSGTIPFAILSFVMAWFSPRYNK